MELKVVEQKVLKKLMCIIEEIKGEEDAKLLSTDNFIEELNFDSLDIVQLIIKLQDVFQIQFGVEPDDIDALTSLVKLVTLIDERQRVN